MDLEDKIPFFSELPETLKVIVIQLAHERFGTVNREIIDQVILEAIDLWLKKYSNTVPQVTNVSRDFKTDIIVVLGILSADLISVLTLVKFFNYSILDVMTPAAIIGPACGAIYGRKTISTSIVKFVKLLQNKVKS